MNRLKELREQSGMKQQTLGDLLCCTHVTISRYESGKRELGSADVCRLCDIFSCTADYLLGRSDVRMPEYGADEAALVLAYRRADERARALVDLALEPFCEKKNAESKESTAS